MKETNLTREHSMAVHRGLVDAQASAPIAPAPVEMTNSSGVDLIEGDVVVVTGTGAIAPTTTANDPRPTGVVQDSIDNGDTGPVAFWGPVDYINVTSTVNAGDMASTSTTTKKATAIASNSFGAFAEFTSAGTSPSGFLFGGRGGLGSSAAASNSTDVAGFTGIGSTERYAPAAHWHKGIALVTASSSNTLGTPNLNLRAGTNVSFGLTDSNGDGALDTVTINSTAAGGGGGGGGTTLTAKGVFVGEHGDQGANSTVTANLAFFQRIVVPFTFTPNKIGVGIQTSSGNIDLGVYSDDGTGLAPGSRIASIGSTASPGTGLQTFTIAPGSMSPGVYWLAFAADNGTISLQYHGVGTGNGGGGPNRFQTKASSFALPASVSSLSSSSWSPVVWLEIA